MKRHLLILAWMMPPLIFPRSLQISRVLRAMSKKGWHSKVVAASPDAEPQAVHDYNLEQFYKDSYDIEYVDPRENIGPKPIWLRAFRFFFPIKNKHYSKWIDKACDTLYQQIAKERPQTFISFAQPWIVHHVALRVKQRYPNIPWVACFSDPWVDSLYFNPENDKIRAKEMQYEKEVISAADIVVFTTQETADIVMGKYPPSWKSKTQIVSHGYDADLSGRIAHQPKSEKFTMVHTGNIYERREPFAFLQALAKLRLKINSSAIHVKLIGYASPAMHEEVEKLALDDIVTFAPAVPFLDSLAIAKSADLLLVIDAPSKNNIFLPSKIVDYLSLRRPILALTPKIGASSRVLGGLGFPTVDPTDETAIFEILSQSMDRWQKGEDATPLPPIDAVKHFDVCEIANDLETAVMKATKAVENKNV